MTQATKLFKSTLRNMVRERIRRKLAERDNLDQEEDKPNPVPPADRQPPEPPSKDITQKDPQDTVQKPPKIRGETPPKPKDVTDPTASPVDMVQLKNERIARFIQTVANTSKADLQFIINDTAPDTKAKTIKLFLKLIGVSPKDVSALLTSTDQTKPSEKDKPAIPPVDQPS